MKPTLFLSQCWLQTKLSYVYYYRPTKLDSLIEEWTRIEDMESELKNMPKNKTNVQVGVYSLMPKTDIQRLLQIVKANVNDVDVLRLE